jgi:ABC-type transport system involved in cytochrome c biogenesis permease component
VYSARAFIGLGGILISAFILAVTSRQVSAVTDQGLPILQSITFILATYSIFAGAGMTSDCVSSEKRDGTLGLLFLTSLNARHILVGKLAANSFNAVVTLLAMVPVMTLSILFGGVSLEMIGMLFVVCINNLLFSLMVGIGVSVFVTSARRGYSLSVLLLLLFHFGIPIMATIIEDDFSIAWMLNGWVQSFFVVGGRMLTGTGFGVPVETLFWGSQGVTLLVTLLVFFSAARKLKRSWRSYTDPVESAPVRHRRKTPVAAAGGNKTGESQRARGSRGGLTLTVERPLDFLFSRRVPEIVSALIILGLCLFYAMITEMDHQAAIPGLFLMNFVLKWQWASSIVSGIHRERRDGTLEFFISTPVNLQSLTRSLGRAAIHDHKFTILVAVIFHLSMLGILFNNGEPDTSEEWMALIACYVMLVFDILAVREAGAWLGLINRSYTRAFLKTMSWVVWLPMWVVWLMFSGLGIIMSMLSMAGRISSSIDLSWLFSAEVVFTVSTAVSVLWSCLCIIFTRAWISRYIRIVASMPLNQKLNFTRLETERQIYRGHNG